MDRIERTGVCLIVPGALLWFGLPLLKMLAFLFTGIKFIGPVICDGPSPNDLGWRLIIGGALLLIAGFSCLFHRMEW